MLAQGSVWERLLRPSEGDLPANFAKSLLSLDFSSADQARYRELSAKAQSGTLTPEEQLDLNDLLTADDVLMILRAKAQSSLRINPAA